jgi:GNAT superfamily N-acetyltransferase
MTEPREPAIRPAEVATGEKIVDVANYSAEQKLRDGNSIHVRAIRADDRERLLRHFYALSEDAIYHRFFGIKRTLSEDELTRLTRVDFVQHVGLVATVPDGNDELFVGVARYVRGKDSSRAEVAFAVLDPYQGHGVATILLEDLSRIARSAGITEFEADVLGDNHRMLEVFAKSGFKLRQSSKDGVVHISFSTAETAEFIQASQERRHKPGAA